MKEQLSNSFLEVSVLTFRRALSKTWPLLHENLAWLVGNGMSIRCWKDTWIPNISSLLPFIPVSANLDLDCPLSDMVLNDGAWNLDLF